MTALDLFLAEVPKGFGGAGLVLGGVEVRDAAFSVAPSRKGFLLRERDYAYIQYGEDAAGGGAASRPNPSSDSRGESGSSPSPATPRLIWAIRCNISTKRPDRAKFDHSVFDVV